MASQRQRLVRRESLVERIKNKLNVYDFGLWLLEELNTNEFEDFIKYWSIPLGIILNITFMIARANATGSGSKGSDDVFGDTYDRRGKSGGWFAWLATLMMYLLCTLSFSNAIYTFQRKRHYRLFEASVESKPRTPSARRVPVTSSPSSSSPFRFISNMLASETAESRAHPDAQNDVWEVSVWEPLPLCLRFFCLFSPGHILVYWLYIPLQPLDPRPSVTVVTSMVLTLLLSVQLQLLQSSFVQQAKDMALIQQEVMHEYDAKFVHPSLQRRVRDAGTQVARGRASIEEEVRTYTPTTQIRRAFTPNPNPNYAHHILPKGENRATALSPSRRATAVAVTPNFQAQTPSGMSTADMSSPIRASAYGISRGVGGGSGAGGGDGGSFGIYTHASSPLKRGTADTSPVRRDISPVRKSLGMPYVASSNSTPVLTSGARQPHQANGRAVRSRY